VTFNISAFSLGLSDFSRQAPDRASFFAFRQPPPGSVDSVLLDLSGLFIERSFSTLFSVDGESADEADLLPGDGACVTTSGECSLRAAIQESNATPGLGRILLPAGTFTLSLAGADEDAAATGDLDITDELEILGVGRDATIVDAAGIDRVFHVPDTALDRVVRLHDLTLRGGSATTSANSAGGGIESFGRTELVGCRVEGNSANFGGGIFNGRTMTIDDCVIATNFVAELPGSGSVGRGGGIAGGSLGQPGSPLGVEIVIRDSAIVDNQANFAGGV
jgi:hypothetical protein